MPTISLLLLYLWATMKNPFMIMFPWWTVSKYCISYHHQPSSMLWKSSISSVWMTQIKPVHIHKSCIICILELNQERWRQFPIKRNKAKPTFYSSTFLRKFDKKGFGPATFTSTLIILNSKVCYLTYPGLNQTLKRESGHFDLEKISNPGVKRKKKSVANFGCDLGH